MGTSKLQIEVGNLLDKTFPQFRIRENYRPDWLISSNLTKLELDFYIEELKIAFEVQGMQHFENIPFFFRDYSEFEKRLLYDQEKRDLCDGNNVRLIEVCSLMDATIEITKIKDAIFPQEIKPSIEFSEEENIPKYIRQHLDDYLSVKGLSDKYIPIEKHNEKIAFLNAAIAEYRALIRENRQTILEQGAKIWKLSKATGINKETVKPARIASLPKPTNPIDIELTKWRHKARKIFIKYGKPMLGFESDIIPQELSRQIATELQDCKTAQEVEDVFLQIIQNRDVSSS